MTVKRVKNDVNGNPRYVFAWFSVPGADSYESALKIAREIGGKKYRGRDFGGGIVLQSYNIKADLAQIGIDPDEIDVI